MSISFAFLRSLLLTGFLSFVAPVLLIGGAIASFMLTKHVPFLEAFSRLGVEQILGFLATFGSGSALQGIVTIGLTCSLVGALFDAYAYYRYQNFRGD